jgi:hypothetical protein
MYEMNSVGCCIVVGNGTVTYQFAEQESKAEEKAEEEQEKETHKVLERKKREQGYED